MSQVSPLVLPTLQATISGVVHAEFVGLVFQADERTLWMAQRGTVVRVRTAMCAHWVGVWVVHKGAIPGHNASRQLCDTKWRYSM